MDKIISTRVDESVAQTIDLLARNLKISKKSIIEKAVEDFAKKQSAAGQMNLFEATHGAWKRLESPDRIREESRRTFQSSITRHQS